MNDTAQMLITVLLALLGIATMLYLWIDSVKEGRYATETRNRKSHDTPKATYIYPTDRKSS